MNEIIKYETDNGAVELSPQIVRQYLVPAGKDGKPAPVTDQEIVMFLNLCRYQKLNPFLREVYLIKYGTQPATMVTGKETFLKRAMKHPKYRGHETFISEDGKVATAKVYVENYQVPITVSVDYDEYVGMKDEYVWDAKLGKNVPTGNKIPNAMWLSKPKTMLKKVALVQALREAFPDSFGGLYSQEEISHVDTESLPTAPITQTAIVDVKVEEVKPEEVKENPDNIFVEVCNAIKETKTLEDLQKLKHWMEIKGKLLNEFQKKAVNAAYKKQKEALTPKQEAKKEEALTAASKLGKAIDDYATDADKKAAVEKWLSDTLGDLVLGQLPEKDLEVLLLDFNDYFKKQAETDISWIKPGVKVGLKSAKDGAVRKQDEITSPPYLVNGRMAVRVKGLTTPVWCDWVVKA